MNISIFSFLQDQTAVLVEKSDQYDQKKIAKLKEAIKSSTWIMDTFYGAEWGGQFHETNEFDKDIEILCSGISGSNFVNLMRDLISNIFTVPIFKCVYIQFCHPLQKIKYLNGWI